MLKNVLVLLFILLLVLYPFFVKATSITDENELYKVESWAENYKTENINGASHSIYGVFAKFYYNDEVAKDTFQVNPQEKAYNSDKTKDATNAYITINESNRVLVIYMDHITPVSNLQIKGIIYDINGNIINDGVDFPILMQPGYVNNTSVYKVLSLHNNFFYFFKEVEIDYSNSLSNSEYNPTWTHDIYFKMFSQSGELLIDKTSIESIRGEYLNNNIQINLNSISTLKRVSPDKLAIGWQMNNHTNDTDKNYIRYINYDGTFDGEKFEVASFEEFEKGLVGYEPVDEPIEEPAIEKKKVIAVTNEQMYEKLKGKIVLTVEQNGEAYFVHPNNQLMYYLGRPDDAFSVMREQGIGITNINLSKISIGLNNLIGSDTDGDGLPDLLEDAIGTDKNSTDSDNDGYNDKKELENNYNSNGGGKLDINNSFVNQQKGKIFLQVENNGEAWYISSEDGKRYFLGRPADAFQVMRNLGLGISNSDFNNLQ